MSQRDVLIVGISGCSSSGKTTIAKLIAELLPGATLIHEDDFFKHDDEIPLNKKFGVKDWDCPEALDLDLFGQELDHIKATGKISAKLVHNNNVDDVSRFCVSKETKETLRKEFNAFEAASDVHVVVVDGFMMFHDPKIACKFDRKLLIRAPYASLKSRRAARSGYQTLDSFWIDPPFYFDEFVYKSYYALQLAIFDQAMMNILSFSPGTLLKTIYTAPLNVHKNDFGLSLDVSYITQRLIVCSYPVIKYPKMLYRHSLKDLVLYLNLTHGTNCWRIYNFKIEVGSSDYSDENLYSLVKQSTPPVCSTIDTGTYLSVFADSSCRSSLSEVCTTRETTTEEVTEIEKTNAIMRFGWLDHSPPPFLMLQDMIESVHEFLCEDSARVVVFHCKMGKGRSGTVAIAYMMKYMQCSLKEASEIFSNNRFRGGITKGVTIASQLRFLRYHEMLMCFGQRIDDRLVTMEIAACRFRLVEIELHDIATFPSIGVGFSKPVIVAKMQAFNKQRSALNDLLSINFDSTNNNCIFENGTSCKGLAALVLDTADLRVSFAIQSDGHEFIKNITQLTSSAHCWLNLYWETVLCSKSDSSTYYRKVELLQEQSRSRISPNLAEFNISWDELDGMKGSQVKGLRLFRSLTLKWHLL